jgi:hypothetical protein
MRVAALFMAAAACTPTPTHLNVKVTIALPSNDPSAAVVKLEGEAYEGEGSSNAPVSGIDARIELDGRLVPLLEDGPGHHVHEPQLGFPGEIRLLGDDEACELEHGPFFTATVDRTEDHLLVTLDPPVQPDEYVLVIRAATSGVTSEQIYPGGAAVELPPGFARIAVNRGVTTEEDDDGLRMGGYVVMQRELPVPRWSNDP